MTGTKPLRFAVVGAGMVAEAHLRSIAEIDDAEATLIYSRSPERAGTLGEKYGLPSTTSLEAALDDEGTDVALILTAPWVHAEQAIRAMKHGKHALVEKPMAVKLDQCDEMIDVAGRTHRKLGVIFQNRFKKGVVRTREYLRAGGLGRPLHISATVKWYRPQSYYEANDWRGKIATEGGGVVFSQAGHSLDLMLHLMGPVQWVFANMVTAPVHTGIDIENLAVVTMRFAGGATGVLEASTALYPGTAERLEIHGTRGAIELESGRVKRWDILDPAPDDAPGDVDEPSGTGASDPMAFPHRWHRLQIDDFCRAVREDREPAVNGPEARKLDAVCDCIYESARTGARVDVPEGAT